MKILNTVSANSQNLKEILKKKLDRFKVFYLCIFRYNCQLSRVTHVVNKYQCQSFAYVSTHQKI